MMIAKGYEEKQKLEEQLEELVKMGLTEEHIDLYLQQWSKRQYTPIRASEADHRYNQPKEEPKASEELVSETISDTEIYRRANLLILEAQRKQVAYGLDKYPEPLNANTWSTIETIDHIIDESIDKLHYLVMLRIKLEQMASKEMRETMEKLDEIVSDDSQILREDLISEIREPFKKRVGPSNNHKEIYDKTDSNDIYRTMYEKMRLDNDDLILSKSEEEYIKSIISGKEG